MPHFTEFQVRFLGIQELRPEPQRENTVRITNKVRPFPSEHTAVSGLYLHMASLEEDHRASDIKQSRYDMAALTDANSL
jgi:hypothetical protein